MAKDERGHGDLLFFVLDYWDTFAIVEDFDLVVLFVDVDANERHVRVALLVICGVDLKNEKFYLIFSLGES